MSPPSLVGRLSNWQGGGIDRRSSIVVGALLIAAPVATWIGAQVMTMGLKDARAAYVAANRDSVALTQAAAAQRRDLTPALTAPGVDPTLEALARALPREAVLGEATRAADGRLTVTVTTADPDRLRAALRRDPATATLRDAGQQRGDGGLVVTLVGS